MQKKLQNYMETVIMLGFRKLGSYVGVSHPGKVSTLKPRRLCISEARSPASSRLNIISTHIGPACLIFPARYQNMKINPKETTDKRIFNTIQNRTPLEPSLFNAIGSF